MKIDLYKRFHFYRARIWTDKEDLVNATVLVVWFDLASGRGTNRAGVESAAQIN